VLPSPHSWITAAVGLLRTWESWLSVSSIGGARCSFNPDYRAAMMASRASYRGTSEARIECFGELTARSCPAISRRPPAPRVDQDGDSRRSKTVPEARRPVFICFTAQDFRKLAKIRQLGIADPVSHWRGGRRGKLIFEEAFSARACFPAISSSMRRDSCMELRGSRSGADEEPFQDALEPGAKNSPRTAWQKNIPGPRRNCLR